MTDPTPNAPAAPTGPVFDGGKSLDSFLGTAIAEHNAREAGLTLQSDPAPANPQQQQQEAPKQEQPTDIKVDAPEKDKPEAPKLKDFENPWEAAVDPEKEEGKETEKKASDAAEPPDPEFKSPQQKNAWTSLKAEARELKEIKPRYEALKAKVAELEKAEPKLPPEIEAKIARAEQLEAAYALEETQEYRQAVTEPMLATKTTLDQVAEFAGVEARALYDALDEPNPLKRASLIRKALTSTENDVGEDAIQLAVQATNEFHKSVVPEMNRLKANAVEIQKSLQGQKTVEAAKMSEKQQAEMKAASAEMYGKLQANFSKIPGLFDDPKVGELMQKATLADPAEKPMFAAYQAQVAAAMPYVVQVVNNLLKQNASLQKLAQSRSGAPAGPAEANRQGPATPSDKADGGRSLMAGLAEMGIR